MDNEPIRVGRIARNAERALNLSLTGEVNIYMESKQVDAWAAKRPDSYLKQLEEIGHILKCPDYVSFDSSKERFAYAKTYVRSGVLSLVLVRVKKRGTPGKWYVEQIETALKTPLPSSYQDIEFARPL